MTVTVYLSNVPLQSDAAVAVANHTTHNEQIDRVKMSATPVAMTGINKYADNRHGHAIAIAGQPLQYQWSCYAHSRNT